MTGFEFSPSARAAVRALGVGLNAGKGGESMVTTLVKFRDARRGNYCTLPSVDVEILEPVYRCAELGCGVLVQLVPHERRAVCGPAWEHVEGEPNPHYVRPHSVCVYCGNSEPGTVRYVQQAWSDETSCDRCGGVEGFPIGD